MLVVKSKNKLLKCCLIKNIFSNILFVRDAKKLGASTPSNAVVIEGYVLNFEQLKQQSEIKILFI